MNKIEKAIREERVLRIKHICNGFSNVEVTDDFQKGEDVDDFNTKEEEIEKSDILDSLFYNNEIKISKTGKEIKEQVDNVILPELLASLAVKENEANEKLKGCGNAPTFDVDSWWTKDIKIDVGYKVYSWEETWFNSEKNRITDSLSYPDAEEKRLKNNCPASQEEADCRRCYNDIVRIICAIKIDIKACEVLKNLNDDTVYELTPRQVISFKF